MRAQTVARIYAETLLRLALEEDALEEVDEGVRVLSGLLEENETLTRFFEAPQIPGDEKRAVIESAFGERFHSALVRFLYLVVDKRREPLFGEIAKAWRELLDERANQVTATIVTAAEIDAETHDTFRVALEESTGKRVTLEQAVDPGLIGGVVVRLGDTVVDGSLRRRLDTLRHMLRTAHV